MNDSILAPLRAVAVAVAALLLIHFTIPMPWKAAIVLAFLLGATVWLVAPARAAKFRPVELVVLPRWRAVLRQYGVLADDSDAAWEALQQRAMRFDPRAKQILDSGVRLSILSDQIVYSHSDESFASTIDFRWKLDAERADAGPFLGFYFAPGTASGKEAYELGIIAPTSTTRRQHGFDPGQRLPFATIPPQAFARYFGGQLSVARLQQAESELAASGWTEDEPGRFSHDACTIRVRNL